MAAFRKIGFPNTRTILLLRRARHSIENSLPGISQKALDRVARDIEAAYGALPLQRLATAVSTVKKLSPRQDAAARQLHHDLGAVLQDLSSRPKPTRAEPEEAFQTFLKQAANRGWRVQDVEEKIKPQDGFTESVDYIKSIALPFKSFLQQDDDFGIVQAPILLLQGSRVPKNILLDWTKPPESRQVYVVFGRYIVVSPMQFLGIRAPLVTMQNGNGIWLDEDKFEDVAQILGVTQDVIYAPQRILHHYYCPIMTIPNQPTRRFMLGWDIPRTR